MCNLSEPELFKIETIKNVLVTYILIMHSNDLHYDVFIHVQNVI